MIRKSKEDIDAAIRAEQAQGMAIKEVIRLGDPIDVVMDIVKEEGIDLLIMLAHEEGHLEHFLFGHSNDEIVRRMPCSIFLVKKEPAIFGVICTCLKCSSSTSVSAPQKNLSQIS